MIVGGAGRMLRGGTENVAGIVGLTRALTSPMPTCLPTNRTFGA